MRWLVFLPLFVVIVVRLRSTASVPPIRVLAWAAPRGCSEMMCDPWENEFMSPAELDAAVDEYTRVQTDESHDWITHEAAKGIKELERMLTDAG